MEIHHQECRRFPNPKFLKKFRELNGDGASTNFSAFPFRELLCPPQGASESGQVSQHHLNLQQRGRRSWDRSDHSFWCLLGIWRTCWGRIFKSGIEKDVRTDCISKAKRKDALTAKEKRQKKIDDLQSSPRKWRNLQWPLWIEMDYMEICRCFPSKIL